MKCNGIASNLIFDSLDEKVRYIVRERQRRGLPIYLNYFEDEQEDSPRSSSEESAEEQEDEEDFTWLTVFTILATRRAWYGLKDKEEICVKYLYIECGGGTEAGGACMNDIEKCPLHEYP
jgi:hypothetical protein